MIFLRPSETCNVGEWLAESLTVRDGGRVLLPKKQQKQIQHLPQHERGMQSGPPGAVLPRKVECGLAN
jgi:hypothetical protein